MPTIMVTTISIMTIHQTTEVKPTPTRETSSHHIYVVCPKSKCTDFPMDELVM